MRPGPIINLKASCALCLPVIFFRFSELVQQNGEVFGESIRRKNPADIYYLFIYSWV